MAETGTRKTAEELLGCRTTGSATQMRSGPGAQGPRVVPGEDRLCPYLTCLTILCILAVKILLAFVPDTRTQLLLTLLSLGVVLVAYALRGIMGVAPENPSGELVREP